MGNEGRVIDLDCKYEGCEKVCKSKGGLVKHQNLKHRTTLERGRFEYGRCGVNDEAEVACLNYERTCGGGSVSGERSQCGE